MKRLFLTLLLVVVSICAKAQFYGGFYHNDPNDWFDKEPYFACQNNYVFNGWGQNITNVKAVINGTEVYTFPYMWEYGKYIVIGRESGVNFTSGDVVSLYWGNWLIGTWTYQPARVLPKIKAKGATGQITKKVWKYLKTIR